MEGEFFEEEEGDLPDFNEAPERLYRMSTHFKSAMKQKML